MKGVMEIKEIIKNIALLINVKTLITFIVVAVFAYLSIKGVIDPQSILQIVTIVIAFYFSSQSGEKSGK